MMCGWRIEACADAAHGDALVGANIDFREREFGDKRELLGVTVQAESMRSREWWCCYCFIYLCPGA
jgi:hypothetical protein